MVLSGPKEEAKLIALLCFSTYSYLCGSNVPSVTFTGKWSLPLFLCLANAIVKLLHSHIPAPMYNNSFLPLLGQFFMDSSICCQGVFTTCLQPCAWFD